MYISTANNKSLPTSLSSTPLLLRVSSSSSPSLISWGGVELHAEVLDGTGWCGLCCMVWCNSEWCDMVLGGMGGVWWCEVVRSCAEWRGVALRGAGFCKLVREVRASVGWCGVIGEVLEGWMKRCGTGWCEMMRSIAWCWSGDRRVAVHTGL